MGNNIAGIVTDFVGDFLSSENNSANISGWLGGTMKKFMPSMSEEEANFAGGIILNTVKSLNSKIQSVQQAENTEEWFRDEFNKETAGFSAAEKGRLLTQAYNGFATAESGFTGEAPEFSEKIPDIEWDNFSLIQMTSDVLKKSGETALRSLAYDTGEIIQQGVTGVLSINGAAEALTSSVGTAVDIGIKCAASGAALIAQKKGWLKKFLPQDASIQEITNIAVGAVETAKAIYAAGAGACSVEEAIDRIQRTVIARAVDFLAENSPRIGESIGMIFGPQGAVIGRVIGEGISYLAKTEVRDFFEKGLNKIATSARGFFSKAKDKVKSGFNKIKESIFG